MKTTASEPYPTAVRLADVLRHAILEGNYSPHVPFPSYRQLCQDYGVSDRRVRGALGILEKEGLICRRERRGTFIRPAALIGERAAASTRLRCINIVTESWKMRSPYSPHMWAGYMAGYTQALEHCHMKTRFVIVSEDDEALEGILAQQYALNEQACILVGMVNSSLMPRLRKWKMPFVVQHHCRYSTDGLPEHHSVFINKTGGAFQATQHLLALGHRRIGFMGRLPGTSSAPRVYEGYRAALRCVGSEPSPNHVFDFATDDVRLASGPAREFLTRQPRPTAILAQTDSVAIGLLEAARDLRIRVPEELSVVGFNDQREAASSDPPLTTVSLPLREHARTGARMAMEAAEGAYGSWQTKILDCHLVVRKSTAVCPTRSS